MFFKLVFQVFFKILKVRIFKVNLQTFFEHFETIYFYFCCYIRLSFNTYIFELLCYFINTKKKIGKLNGSYTIKD